jgi:tetratricopeptide (TPR) repeat protein
MQVGGCIAMLVTPCDELLLLLLLLLVVAVAQVAVLAASIEASAGEVNAARALFLRAYQLNKADKQLYMQWPRMEGACSNIERARLLFGYGLSLYPNNTKILNLYACFEEEQGEVELARELHQRALGIDSASVTSMHNRSVQGLSFAAVRAPGMYEEAAKMWMVFTRCCSSVTGQLCERLFKQHCGTPSTSADACFAHVLHALHLLHLPHCTNVSLLQGVVGCT